MNCSKINTPFITTTSFFYRQYFYKQLQAETGKNEENAKQHPRATLLLFENYSHSLSTLSSKNNETYSKK